MSVVIPEIAQVETHKLNYNDIANKLLQDQFFLTALELHTELVEKGKECRLLKDFFSNPGNFEYNTSQEVTPRISRSESQATLDSLDLARYSEDGGGTDERIAVLEFELRKAKETINALRNHLTVATECDITLENPTNNVDSIKPHEQRALNFLINEYLFSYGFKLTSITFADENQNQDFDDWDDVGLNIPKPPELLVLYREGLKQTNHNCACQSTQTKWDFVDSESLNVKVKELEEECEHLKTANANLMKENDLLSSQMNTGDFVHPKTGSESPSEHFELLDNKHLKRDSNTPDNLSNNSFNGSDWTNVSHEKPPTIAHELDNKSITSQKEEASKDFVFKLSFTDDSFKKEVFSLCYVNIPQKVDNDILDSVLNNAITHDSLINTLSLSLPKIIPNIILNKRDEAIPLLITAIRLNANSGDRDKLLQQLFNLKKKPSDTERIMILSGIVGIAKCCGVEMVENEILPQCWEQLGDKHVEKRLLVAEACTALLPYVSSQIRNSLILSMFQQMSEDREEIVRESVLRAFALLMALCEDPDKYNQCEEMSLHILLNDNSTNVQNLAEQILFPVLGRWALLNGRLTSNLMTHLLQKLNELLKLDESANESRTSDRITAVVRILQILLPFLLIDAVMSVDVSPLARDGNTGDRIGLRLDLEKICTNLTNPLKFLTADCDVGLILREFDRRLVESPDEVGSEVAWILDVMLPDLINNLNHIELNRHPLLHHFLALFSHLCLAFGPIFTALRIRPLFAQHIASLHRMLAANQCITSNTTNILPVYLVSILAHNDPEEVCRVLRTFLFTLPLCGGPLDALHVSVRCLCGAGRQRVVLEALWEGVVHGKPLVRAATSSLFGAVVAGCERDMLVGKVAPALITLGSDSDVLVKAAAVPALGKLITDCTYRELHDKAYMQFESYISDKNFKENHTLLRQLIVTLGNVANACTNQFRHETILPNLSAFAAYTQQMSNVTRKVDLAQALIEAYTTLVYSPSRKQHSASILHGLRCLECVVMENPSLAVHKDTVLSMMRECDENMHLPSPSQADGRASSRLGQNVNQGVEEMKQRVTKMFNKPATVTGTTRGGALPNLQTIFKKK